MLYYNDKNQRELHLVTGDVHEVTSSEKGAANTKLQLVFGCTGVADKSLARPGRKQATATEDFEFQVSYL